MADKTDDDGPRATLFGIPFASFDPKSAADTTLKQFGILARPADDTSAQYRQLWNRMYSRTMNFMVPQLKPRARSLRTLKSEKRSCRRAV